jgi:hypothetical protein
LTEENHKELFLAVVNKSKLEVQALLAARFPRPDKPSRIRRSTIEHLSESRFAIEFTASAALRDKLERCRDLLSHANPSRDLGVVIERAVDLLLEDLESRRLARAKRPRRARNPRNGRSSGITSATRRTVFERDGMQCTFVAANGHRCKASAFLELDHVEPRALGGSNQAHNLRVRCRAHNQLWAEQCFGRERVDRNRHFCRKKRRAEKSHTLDKVHAALRSLGFRDSEARNAVATVVKLHDANEPLLLDQALREAVLVATAA